MDDRTAEQRYTDNLTKFRVWHIPQVPMDPFYYEVPDIKTALVLTDALAMYDIFQLEKNIKPDFANANGVEGFCPQQEAWESIDDMIEFMKEDGVL